MPPARPPPGDLVYEQLHRAGAGRMTALCNLCNIALGSGVLGFPGAFQQGGWLYTSAFIAAFALLGAFSNSIMIRSCSWYRVVSFHSVAREALGPRAGAATAAAMVVYSFGGCAAFTVMVGDFLAPACEHARGAAGWQANDAGHAAGGAGVCSRQFLMVVVGAAVVLPLCLRSSVAALDRPSRLAVVGVCYLAAAVVYRSAAAFAARGFSLPGGVKAVAGTPAGRVGPTGTIAWSFAVMLGIPNVFAELKASPAAAAQRQQIYAPVSEEEGEASSDAPTGETTMLTVESAAALNSVAQPRVDAEVLEEGEEEERRRVASMDAVITQQAAITAVTYVLVGLGGYLHFGEAAANSGGNLLTLYSSEEAEGAGDPLMDTVRVTLSLVAAVSYPIIHFTSRLMLHDLCLGVSALAVGWRRGKSLAQSSSSGHRKSVMSRPARWGLTVCFWTSTTAFALRGYDLGTIFALFGSTMSISTMLFMPGLLLLDDAGPWHHPAYRTASLCGCQHRYGGRRRRALGSAMLACGVLICGVSVALLFGVGRSR
jgi:amino acid permease